MRELNVMEVESVSGGWFFGNIAAAILGGIVGMNTGAAKVAVTAGSTGGILGVGVVSAIVGAVWGAIGGGIQGAAYGLINGWDKMLNLFNSNSEQWADITNPAPKV